MNYYKIDTGKSIYPKKSDKEIHVRQLDDCVELCIFKGVKSKGVYLYPEEVEKLSRILNEYKNKAKRWKPSFE